jgi:hypothetical protein
VRDWRRGIYLAPHQTITQLSKTYAVRLPSDSYVRISEASRKRQAGQKGGRATIAKFGRVPVREERRKRAWQHWWETVGQYETGRVTSVRSINTPQRTSQLAEFIGILLGDGTIAPYHVAVFLNSERDRDYICYVSSLIQELFAVEPKVYPHPTRLVTAITVARKSLVTYLISLGLPQGDKIQNGARIPAWLMQDIVLLTACLRGLFDTDGSVYPHTYTRNEKQYTYVKVNFSSASQLLLSDVSFALHALDIQHTVHKKLIAIDSKVAVQKFARTIGSSNTKHLKRLPV